MCDLDTDGYKLYEIWLLYSNEESIESRMEKSARKDKYKNFRNRLSITMDIYH